MEMLKQITLFKSFKRSTSHVKNKENLPKKSSVKKTMSVINLDCDFDEDNDQAAFLDALSQEDVIKLDHDVQMEPKDPLTDNNGEDVSTQPTATTTANLSRSMLSTSLIHSELIPGFDEDAGQTWIYPINYPIRDYQFNIVHKALFKNTLVSLPTGLGKTFIAAVVMYNMYRWYPRGKVVFMAPTKPLVAQQIEACYKIVGISQEVMGEMTGNLSPVRRKQMWTTKRVFFLTPQVMQNDLARCACDAEDIKCVVFDEAHKALGNHSYCQVIRELSNVTTNFRVLALTATPGDDLKAVQQVVTNMMISNIEIRSEDSFDIQPYTNTRKHEKVVIPLEGEIKRLRTEYLKVLEGLVQRLVTQRAMYAISAERIHKFQLLQSRSQFRSNPPPNIKSDAQRNQVEGDFSLGISLYHAFELLELHGMRNFYHYLKNSVLNGGRISFRAKLELAKNPALMEILQVLDGYFSSGDVVDGEEPHNPGSSPRMGSARNPKPLPPGPYLYSHPKLKKLEEIVVEHFQQWDNRMRSTGSIQETRVMIFSQYRESVREIADLLCRHAPLVRVMSFVGQASSNKTSKGLTQKEQLEVVKNFRQGGYNTLVSTCVGEEGLDIGEVDLIVCFDSSKSPIRLVQRMGRTGRKRDGRVVSLMTQGKEEQAYMKSESNKKHIHKAIVDGCRTLQFYSNSPRMVPRQIQPKLHKMHINVVEFTHQLERKRSVPAPRGNLKGKGQQSRLSFGLPVNTSACSLLTDKQLVQWKDKYALDDKEARSLAACVRKTLKPSLLSKHVLASKSTLNSGPPATRLNDVVEDHACISTTSGEERMFDIGRWSQWQTAPADTKSVGHSKVTRNFLSVMELADYMGTNPEMGANYDLEMKTFLNKDDVAPTPFSASPQNEEDVVGRRKESRKPAGILMSDDEEDEDFEGPGLKVPARKEANLGGVPSMGTDTVSVKSASMSDSDTASLEDVDHGNLRVSPLKDCNVDGAGMTSTPFMDESNRERVDEDFEVPPPPSFSELEWMEGMGSQPSSQLLQSRTDTPSHSYTQTASYTKAFGGIMDGETPFTPASTSRAPTLPPSSGEFKVPPVPSSTPKKTPISTKCLATCTPCTESELDCSGGELFSSPPLPNRALRKSPHVPVTSLDDRTASSSCVDLEDDSFSLMHKTRTLGKRNAMKLTTPSPGRESASDSSPTVLPPCSHQKDSESIVVEDADIESPIVSRSHKRRKAHFRSDDSLIEEDVIEENLDEGEGSNSATELSEDPEEDWQKIDLKRRRKKAKEFIEGEAELSEEDIGKYSSDEPDDLDNYNMADSFINDATLLTQVTPTQPAKSRKIHRTPKNMFDVYRKSLRSPHDTLFSSRPKNHSKFRMVLSQRHGILRRYAKKAGFGVPFTSPDGSGEHTTSAEETNAEENTLSSELSEAEEVLVPFGEESEEKIDGEIEESVCIPERGMDDASVFEEEELYKDIIEDLLADDEEEMDLKTGDEVCVNRLPVANTTHQVAPSRSLNQPSTTASTVCPSIFPSVNNPPSVNSRASVDLPPVNSGGSSDLPPTNNASCSPHTAIMSLGNKASVQTDSEKTFKPSIKVSPGFKILRPGSTRLVSGSPTTQTTGESTRNEATTDERAFSQAVGPGIIRDVPGSDELLTVDLERYSIGMEEYILSSDDEDTPDLDDIHDTGTGDCESFVNVFEEDIEGGVNSVGSEQDIFDEGFTLDDHILLEDDPVTTSTQYPSSGAKGDNKAPFSPQVHSDPGQTGTVLPSPTMSKTGTGSLRLIAGESGGSTWPTNRSTTLQKLKQQMMNQETQGNDSELRIFADSREISKSMIISQLRQKHKVHVEVCQLGVCCFAVSYRMCVERRSVTDFTTHVGASKTAERLKQMSLLYSKRCLIVEKDRIKDSKRMWTKPPKANSYYEQCMAQLMLTDVLVLFSEGPEETSQMLVRLAQAEFQKGHRIRFSLPSDSDSAILLKILQQIPVVSLPLAVGLCGVFASLRDIAKSSPQEMCKKLSSLSFSKASKIHQFLHHKCCTDLA